MIKPTVGRVVHYYPAADDLGAKPAQGQPLAALIARVWSDACVNLAYMDANGVSYNKTSVLLVQDDDAARPGSGYCAWMPYQKGQAAKTEALENAIAKSDPRNNAGFIEASVCACGPHECCSKCPSPAEDAIEQEIQAKGLTAPRITPAGIEAAITSEHYFTAGLAATFQAGPIPDSLHLLTFCVLVLRNGFTVTGESACASPENFDAEIGRKIARQNAVQKVWQLEGYLLRERLHLRAVFDAEPKTGLGAQE